MNGEKNIETVNLRAEINEIIENAADSIQSEFEQTENTWFDCFVTVITPIYGYLDIMHSKGQISESEYEVMHNDLEHLVNLIRHQQQMFKEKSALPSDEVRHKLLDYLKHHFWQKI